MTDHEIERGIAEGRRRQPMQETSGSSSGERRDDKGSLVVTPKGSSPTEVMVQKIQEAMAPVIAATSDITRRLEALEAVTSRNSATRPVQTQPTPTPPQEAMLAEDVLRMMADIQRLDHRAMERIIHMWNKDK